MTFKTENEAEAWGCRMLKKYFPNPTGWFLDVWENQGWHVGFEHGEYVHVYWDSTDRQFWCLLGSDHGGGKPEWGAHPPIRARKPVVCVQRTLALARQHLRSEIDRYNETAAGICREKLSLQGECLPVPCGVSTKDVCDTKPTGATGAILGCKKCPPAKQKGRRV